MREPIQPQAHRVNVQINSHISAENADAWKEIVLHFGGSVELAFDALLVTSSSRPLHLSTPRLFQDKLARAYQRVEAVESAYSDHHSKIDTMVEESVAQIDVALTQLEASASSLRQSRHKLLNLRRALSNEQPTKAVDEAISSINVATKMLDDFTLAPPQ